MELRYLSNPNVANARINSFLNISLAEQKYTRMQMTIQIKPQSIDCEIVLSKKPATAIVRVGSVMGKIALSRLPIGYFKKIAIAAS